MEEDSPCMTEARGAYRREAELQHAREIETVRQRIKATPYT